MKILVYSDLHLEFSDFTVPTSGFDAVVLAGDIHVGDRAVRWAHRNFDDVPVIYICGNHEFYGGEIGYVQDRIRAAAFGSNVYFFENESVYIDDVQFICSTLWTDFCVSGNKELNMIQAGRWMNDYRLIELGDRFLEPHDTERMHHASRQFLESELTKSKEKPQKTVVVTHHAPSARSLLCERVSQDSGAAYASSLDMMMIEHSPDLWIHGHTHESVDYQIGETRVLSNPRGYSRIADGWGNRNFKPICIIEV